MIALPPDTREIDVDDIRVGDFVLLQRARKWRRVTTFDRYGNIVCKLRPDTTQVTVVVPRGIRRAARPLRPDLKVIEGGR